VLVANDIGPQAPVGELAQILNRAAAVGIDPQRVLAALVVPRDDELIDGDHPPVGVIGDVQRRLRSWLRYSRRLERTIEVADRGGTQVSAALWETAPLPSEESPMAKKTNLINAAGKPSAAARSRVGARRRRVAWPRGAHCAAQPLTVTNPRNASWQSGGVRFDG
jgi:hypothetical protein